MKAVVAADAIEREVDEIDPRRDAFGGEGDLGAWIDELNRRIAERNFDLARPFVARVDRRSDVPLFLSGTFSTPIAEDDDSGELRHREWRAELDPRRSGPRGPTRYEIAYRAHWTSDWYRDL